MGREEIPFFQEETQPWYEQPLNKCLCFCVPDLSLFHDHRMINHEMKEINKINKSINY